LARLEEEEPDNLGKTKEEEIAVAIADVTIDQDEGGEGDS